jgi:hypothetical protein
MLCPLSYFPVIYARQSIKSVLAYMFGSPEICFVETINVKLNYSSYRGLFMDIVWKIWDYVCALVLVFLIYYLLMSSLGSRDKSRLAPFIGAVIIAAVNVALAVLGAREAVFPYVNIALNLVYARFLFGGSITKRVLWACASSVIMMAAWLAALALADVLYYDNLAGIMGSVYTSFYVSSVFILAAAAFVIAVVKPNPDIRTKEYRMGAAQNIFVVAITAAAAVVADVLVTFFFTGAAAYSYQADRNIYDIAAILYSVIMAAMFLFIFSYAGAKQLEYEKGMELDRLGAEISYYRQKELAVKSLRELRHDISTHMHVMKTLVEQGKNKQLVDYFDNISGKYKKDNALYLSGNSVLNAMLTSKADEAAKYGVEIKLTYDTEKEIPLPYAEFCSLTGNLIDNAIEASGKVFPEGERYIDVIIGDKGEMVYIKVENASDGKYIFDDGELRSAKGSPRHGLGLKRIKSIAEGAGGFFDVNPQPDRFTAFVMLPPQGKETDHG